MKIYFAGSIRGGRNDAALYYEIIQFLSTFGEVLTEHVGDARLSEAGDDGPDDRHIHDRDMDWLRRADLIVAEVTQPSLGVGYELGWACALNKPVLALYRPDEKKLLSAMVAGSKSITTKPYQSIDQAKAVIREYILTSSDRFGLGIA